VCPQQLDHTQDARIHYATLNTPPHSRPTTPPPPPHTRALDERATSGHHQRTHPPTGVSSGPNSVPKPSSTNGFCVPPSHTHHNHTHTEPAAHGAREIRDKETQPPHRPPTITSDPPPQPKKGGKTRPESLPVEGLPHQHGELLRKEVIQPHLPVRLPCYDFVPIAGPTFDDSLPRRG
jgi:hypothetical protein